MTENFINIKYERKKNRDREKEKNQYPDDQGFQARNY